jgi:nickel/cobalt transporter (NiCoT) family protein
MANFDINKAGFAIAALFVVVWGVAIGYRKLGNLDTRWTPAAVAIPPAAAEPAGEH